MFCVFFYIWSCIGRPLWDLWVYQAGSEHISNITEDSVSICHVDKNSMLTSVAKTFITK